MSDEKIQPHDMPHLSFIQKAGGVFAPAALSLTGLQIMLHAPLPMEIAFLVGAGFLAHKSPEIYANLRSQFPTMSGKPAHHVPEQVAPTLPLQQPDPNKKFSFTDRMMGRHFATTGQQLESVTERLPEVDLRKTRVVETEEIPQIQLEEGDGLIDFSQGDTQDEEDFLPTPRRSGKFLFSEVLQGFTPSLRKIYLGTLPNGTQLFCEAKDLCHVALAGSTGGGKSSIMRMIVAQLCKAGARVLLLNPHYTRYDLDNKEDWTPFDPYLYRPAMESRTYDMIGRYLEQVATEILPKRLEKYAHSQPVGKPYFIVLDELPAIVDEIKNAPAHLSKILRQGRKVGIFLIVASQDFLVKTLFPDGGGGAVRECYRTAFYVGGDATTARILLDMPANQVPEDELGRGTVMMRGGALKKAMMAHVPYVDNASLYSLLGPSTFKQGKSSLAQDDELIITGNTERTAEEIIWQQMMNDLANRPDVRPELDESHEQRGARTNASYGIVEGASQAQSVRHTEPVCAHVTGAQTAVREPESTTHDDTGSAQPRMSSVEVERFIVAYRLTGNKDTSLKEAGVNTRYRGHATQIIQTHGLSKKNGG